MRRTLVLILLQLVATAASGGTITVRRDGTGDFAVLHQALDAAADGDTVLIGPGEFTETKAIRPSNYSTDVAVYGEIAVPRITIIGAGADVTIIGPITYAPDYAANSPGGLVSNGMRENIAISDLTVRNCFFGIAIWSGFQMDRCHVDNNYYGVHWTAIGSGGAIRNSRFANIDPPYPIGLYVRGVAGVAVEDCEFVSATPYVDNAGATFRNCSSIGPAVDGFYSASGTCELWNCRIAGVEIGLTTGYVGSRCEVHDSEIEGSWYALRADQRTSLLVENSALTGGSDSVVFLRDADAIAIHGCDLVRGTGPVIRCTRPAVWGAVTHDLTDNFWGTTSEADIQSWIIDSNDDSNIHATVLYSPFAGQSVPSETTTWGDLKALWR